MARKTDKSADDMMQDIEQLSVQLNQEAEAEADAPESPPEPEAEEAPAEPEVVDDRPLVDEKTGRDIIYPKKSKPEPPAAEAAVPEQSERVRIELTAEEMAELKKHGFKSGDGVKKSWLDAQRALSRERNERRAEAEEMEALRREVAEVRGHLAGLSQREQTPEAPEPTDEQIAELFAENPVQAVRYMQHQAERKVEARMYELQETLAADRTQRTVAERRQFALKHIPELGALAQAEEGNQEPDPEHAEFAQRYLNVIRQYPDMAQSNEKMVLAADSVRMQMFREKQQAGGPAVSTSKKASAPAPKGTVFLEDTSGKAATSQKIDFAKMTADEIRDSLIDRGVGVLDRD